MPRRALALQLALLTGTLLAPAPAAADTAPGIAAVAFSPRPLVVGSGGDYDIAGRFTVTLPSADSAVETIAFRLLPLQGSSPVPLSLSARGCEAPFICTRSGQVLSVTMAMVLVDKTLKAVYRSPGSYRPVASVGFLGGPVLTGTGTKIVKVRRDTKCNLEVVPKQARSGAPLTLHGRLTGRAAVAATVALWFDPAGKPAPVKVRTVRVPKNELYFQPVVTHRGTGTWQARYRGDAQYAACNTEPAKVRTG